ncbi:MAG: HAD-IIB family hydrolase [Gammaproteobacteria bacterium]|nr:HAD-IIB family hydrolase [Gammaproteobacteria bacterium]
MAYSSSKSSSNSMQLVIITDLDGSLLDHHSYSYAAAVPRLAELAAAEVPVVLCTSKTLAEVAELRDELGNQSPFIVENGAAVYLPRDYFAQLPPGCVRRGDYDVFEFCPPRSHWLELLEQAKQAFPDAFDHFAAMSVARVAELTGLSLAQAERARDRGYGEPLQWLASDEVLQAFSRWFAERGARVLRGGRFVHVAGQSDKGRALRWLVSCYQQAQPQRQWVSLALGDSHNDVDMLEQADCAVVIRSPSHAAPTVSGNDNVYVTRGYGPAGWVEGVDYWLAQLAANPTGE